MRPTDPYHLKWEGCASVRVLSESRVLPTLRPMVDRALHGGALVNTSHAISHRETRHEDEAVDGLCWTPRDHQKMQRNRSPITLHERHS